MGYLYEIPNINMYKYLKCFKFWSTQITLRTSEINCNQQKQVIVRAACRISRSPSNLGFVFFSNDTVIIAIKKTDFVRRMLLFDF